MTLRLYNTLTRTKEEFKPLDPKNVRMYVCGPTVYDYAHIGNARPVIVFDVLFRLLRHLYGEKHVTYVRNITDIDDKINARAREEGTSIRELTERTYGQFRKDISALGVLEPTYEPRATETVPEMIDIIQRLIARGHAYEAEGHVLFAVPSMKDYGKLSRRPLDEMIAGARVDVAPYKKDPMDFVLWKPSDAETPGWDSPWGRGRPGWHIECSAMSWKHLGETFDIHGGGIDLVFPHHENELAQTVCAFDTPSMAAVWMHNGFLQVEGRKMAKSEGNFITINELLNTERFGGRKWPGEVLRLAMLMSPYAEPIDWTLSLLNESFATFSKWRKAVAHLINTRQPGPVDELVLEALLSNLDTPRAISRLHELESLNGEVSLQQLFDSMIFLGLLDDELVNDAVVERVVKKELYSDHRRENFAEILSAHLRPSANVSSVSATFSSVVPTLKWLSPDNRDFFVLQTKEIQKYVGKDLPLQDARIISAKFVSKLNGLIERRLVARQIKNWAESDRIRDELAAMGVVLKDNKDGTTTWEVKR